jgi:pyruvate dehydrogenase E2 component (dihydrolipoamide acetyltransferase)
MAKIEVVMPQMGESITTGTITKWHKQPGDLIEVDELLLEISTDKVESEIPSPVSGRVWTVLFKEGDTVDVSVLIAEIEEDTSLAFSGGPQVEDNRPSASIKDQASVAQKVDRPVAQPTASSKSSRGRFYTPLVKSMAQAHKVPLSELEHLPGSGAGGRVNRSDLENYLSNRSSSSTTSQQVQSKVPSSSGLKSMAQGGVEVIPMDGMRKAIAKNMVLSKQTSPHVNSISEVDLTHLVKFRESFKNQFFEQEGMKLTYTPFIMYAIIQSLAEYPLLNSSVEGESIVMKKDINLGFAVAVPGNGLTVPVIKNADVYNMRGLCRELNKLANKARDRKLSMDDLTGGTFTFTNVGSFGTLLATPIILQPQVGIYAAGAIQKRVVVGKDDSLAVRSMMYGTHTYDHRIIDGQLGGLFLESIHRNLKNMEPEKLF